MKLKYEHQKFKKLNPQYANISEDEFVLLTYEKYVKGVNENLIKACIQCDYSKVKDLLENEEYIDPNYQDRYGNRAIDMCISNECWIATFALIKHGADFSHIEEVMLSNKDAFFNPKDIFNIL